VKHPPTHRSDIIQIWEREEVDPPAAELVLQHWHVRDPSRGARHGDPWLVVGVLEQVVPEQCVARDLEDQRKQEMERQAVELDVVVVVAAAVEEVVQVAADPR
jgi:hypothetical protein